MTIKGYEIKKAMIFFFIGLALCLYGMQGSLSIKISTGEDAPMYLIALMIVGACTAFLSYLSLDDDKEQEQQKHTKQKDWLLEQKIEKNFNDGKEILIRVPRGFVTLPFVISKGNGWKYDNGHFIIQNEHFSLSDIVGFQREY
jgi:hypothetical protein